MLGMTYCIVWKRISILLCIIPFICLFFCLSNQNFCHRFFASYESQSLEILYTHSEWPSILWKRKPRCWDIFLLSFFIFLLSIYHSNVIHINRWNFVTLCSGIKRPTKLKLGTHMDNMLMLCAHMDNMLMFCVCNLFLSLQFACIYKIVSTYLWWLWPGVCELVLAHYLLYLSHVMRKPVYAICEQQRCRSACASVQSDQCLCYSMFR